MLCLMREYFQQSQNACSVSSALHQLAGTLLIRQRTEGIRVGGRERVGGRMREGGGVREKIVCTSIYTPSSIFYFHLTLELSVFPLLSMLSFSLWLCLVTIGRFSPGKH